MKYWVIVTGPKFHGGVGTQRLGFSTEELRDNCYWNLVYLRDRHLLSPSTHVRRHTEENDQLVREEPVPSYSAMRARIH